jgi:formate/nitrite transporter FocA (FNT family)
VVQFEPKVVEVVGDVDLSQLAWIGFMSNLIPVTLGNIVGGSFCWASVLVYLFTPLT